MRLHRSCLALAVLLVAALAAPAMTLPAQAATYFTIDGKEPQRPKLPAGADTNDARAYLSWGNLGSTPWKKSFDAYYWAYRLDPTNEYYRLAMRNAVYWQQSPEWRFAYSFERAAYAMKSKQAKLLDTLETLVYLRDPLVHAISSECKADADIVRYYAKNSYMLGEYFYEIGCYTQAAQQFGDALAKRPDWLDVRYSRARSLYFVGQHGNAIAELQVLLDSLRARDQKRTRRYYVSKEVLELMRGDMLVATQDYFNAKKAYARSLEENVAYGPAHVRLARVALAQDELDEALQEYDQALQIEEKDPAVHNDYGVALMKAKKWPEAEAQFRRAVELEPYFALPYFNLAVTLDNQGKRDEAVASYRGYIARAPGWQARNVTMANARLAALGQAAGTE